MNIKHVISIPVWDRTDRQSQFTVNIVQSILRTITSDSLLVVVDNASPHTNTRDFLAGVKDDRFRTVRFEKNEGVSRGYNVGFLMGYEMGAEYFIAMNNDILVHGDDWLEKLIAPVKENPKVIAGPRLITGNLNVDRDGFKFDYLEGFMMAFHRHFLDVAGVFDEQFSPAYCEDVEICWRGTILGFCLMEVSVPINHVYGQTGYVSVPDEERIRTTLSNVKKLHEKVLKKETNRVWYGN